MKLKPSQHTTKNPEIVAGASSNKNFHISKIRTRLPLLTVALAILVVGIFAFKTPVAEFSASKNQCASDSELLDLYNKTVRAEGVTKLQPIVEKINKKNISNDATCSYMLMVAQYGGWTSGKDRDAYNELKQLESRGKQVSNKISDGIDRAAIEKIIQNQMDDHNRGYYGQG